jgi:hypothetical protein
MAVAVAAPDAAQKSRLMEACRLGGQARFAEAEAALREAGEPDDARFARAVLQFNRPARTVANADEAIALFAELAATSATAEARARARYFQARAEDLRSIDGPDTRALAVYDQLEREHPGTAWAERAVVHRLLHAFYADEARVEMLARCAALVEEGKRIRDPLVRAQFHQVAARGYLQTGGHENEALEHLLAAEAGVVRREARSDLLVSIGQVAADLGQVELAASRYEAFLREFSHDPRVFTVRALRDALPAAGLKGA